MHHPACAMTAADSQRPVHLNLAAVREHLGRYLGAPGQLHVCSTDDWPGLRVDTTPDGIALAVDWVRDADAMGADGIYHRGTTVRPNAPRRGRGLAQDSLTWLAVQLDVDYGKPGYAPDAATAHTLVLSSGVPAPTDWVASGHGLYPVWRLTSPAQHSPFLHGLVLDLHAAVSAAFERAGYRIDPGVTDAARVWRIPGTVNRKRDEAPVPCQVMAGVGTGKTMAADRLRRAVPVATPAEAAPEGRAGAPLADRLFTLSEAQAYVEAEALAPLRAAGEGERNHRLNASAVVVGHFLVDFGLTSASATDLLLSACPSGWDEPDNVRRATIRSGLKRGMAEPYVLRPDAPAGEVLELVSNVVAPAAEGGSPSGVAAGAVDDSASAAWTPDVVAGSPLHVAVESERNRRRARQILDAEGLPPVRVLDFAAFLATPKVEYLVPGMLWRAGTARIFGPPGGTKSFLALDVALSLAAGVPWRERDLGRGLVHYVMAEGQGVNAARTLAWMAERAVTAEQLAETFRPITSGVLLTPEGVAAYLERVRVERPLLIVLDTKARMMAGSVNRPEDNAALVRAVDLLKEASGGCVLLIDHTGVHDLTRAKGDNTVEAAMDTEISVSRDKDSGLATAKVTRDKAAEDGTEWCYRLARREDAAVCAPVYPSLELDEAPLAVPHDRWWDVDVPVPDDVERLLSTGRGKHAALDTYRVLRFVGGDRGVLPSEIRTMLREGPRQHDASVITRGLALLAEKGITGPGATDSRLVLAPDFVPELS